MEYVYLGIGSNLGESAEIIISAFAELSKILCKARISSLWRSKARYVENQPDFYNAVVTGSFSAEPRDLLIAINQVETDFGRDRNLELRRGPRPLDIDILLFGKRIIVESDLLIPHVGLRERKFALLPLLELDPMLVDPASSQLFSDILANLPPQGIYLLPPRSGDRLYI